MDTIICEACGSEGNEKLYTEVCEIWLCQFCTSEVFRVVQEWQQKERKIHGLPTP